MVFYSFCDLHLLNIIKKTVRIVTMLMKNNDFYKHVIKCISTKSERINKIIFLKTIILFVFYI